MNERANFAGPDAGEGAVTESDALGALDRFRNLKVLVYGDFILDGWVGVAPPSGWTPADTERIRVALQQSETADSGTK